MSCRASNAVRACAGPSALLCPLFTARPSNTRSLISCCKLTAGDALFADAHSPRRTHPRLWSPTLGAPPWRLSQLLAATQPPWWSVMLCAWRDLWDRHDAADACASLSCDHYPAAPQTARAAFASFAAGHHDKYMEDPGRSGCFVWHRSWRRTSRAETTLQSCCQIWRQLQQCSRTRHAGS